MEPTEIGTRENKIMMGGRTEGDRMSECREVGKMQKSRCVYIDEHSDTNIVIVQYSSY
jgi:hypothetical protein